MPAPKSHRHCFKGPQRVPEVSARPLSLSSIGTGPVKPIFPRPIFLPLGAELVRNLSGADVGAFLHDLGDRAHASYGSTSWIRWAGCAGKTIGQLYCCPNDLMTPLSIAMATVNGLNVEPSWFKRLAWRD